MIEYVLCIIMLEIPRKEVDFEEKVFIVRLALALPLLSDLTVRCKSFWCTAAARQKTYCSSSILAKRYAANNFSVVIWLFI